MSKAGELSEADRHLLSNANAFTHCGGLCAYNWQTAQRLEKLRKAGLLKFWRRRSRKWITTFYDITPAGRAALPTPDTGRAP